MYHVEVSCVPSSICILRFAVNLCLLVSKLLASLLPIFVPLFPIPVPFVDPDAVQLHALSYVLGVA